MAVVATTIEVPANTATQIITGDGNRYFIPKDNEFVEVFLGALNVGTSLPDNAFRWRSRDTLDLGVVASLDDIYAYYTGTGSIFISVISMT